MFTLLHVESSPLHGRSVSRQPITAGEPACDAVLRRRQRVAFAAVFFAAQLIGGLPLSCSGTGSTGALGPGVPSISRKLQGRFRPKARGAGIVCLTVRGGLVPPLRRAL
jgi:hypothetical protein